MSSFGQPPSEPAIQRYQLWIDVYDLVNCDDLLHREQVSVKIRIGSEASKERQALIKASTKSLTWGSNPKMDTLEIDLPEDIEQIPDLFIDILSKTTFGYKERLGFIRIKPKEIY